MKKRLFIRFFEIKESAIPTDLHELEIKTAEGFGDSWFTTEFDDEISDWMLKYPNGKVDFVWL